MYFNQRWINLYFLKVAAEYNNPGAFYAQTTSDIGSGYTMTSTYDISVTIQVKAMEFWVSNPVRKIIILLTKNNISVSIRPLHITH